MTKARDIASAIPAPSTVSSAELGFLDGVTSAIQTQVDAKQASSTAVTLTGTQTLTNKTLTSPVIASVVNNTLTSTTGDIIYASGANTPARLGIGSSAQVLTVASGVPSWATPSSGGMTLISETTASALSSLTYSSLGSYKQLLLIWSQVNYSANGVIGLRFNNNTGSVYTTQTAANVDGAGTTDFRTSAYIEPVWSLFGQSVTQTTTANRGNGFILIDNYTSTTKYKTFNGRANWRDNQYGNVISVDFTGSFNDTTAITTIDIYQHTSTPTFTNQTGGSFRLYGLS
jgi:hypothetical protein